MKHAFLWSVRRELWEHRAVWIAPLAVAAFVLVAFLIGAGHATAKMGSFAALPAAQQRELVAMPFGLAASVVLLSAFIVGAFLSLEALNAERRDRSILFWKSMPVSDRITVLAKAVVPIAVVPAIGFAIALAAQAVLLAGGAIVLGARGFDVGPLFERLPIAAMTVALLYGVVVHALWYAPLYALFLLVSAATRRPLPWILLPPIVAQVLERIAFGTAYTGVFIQYRLGGAMGEAFVLGPKQGPVLSLSQLDPARFFSSPGLWLGLAAAVVFLFITVRLRRSKEPL